MNILGGRLSFVDQLDSIEEPVGVQTRVVVTNLDLVDHSQINHFQRKHIFLVAKYNLERRGHKIVLAIDNEDGMRQQKRQEAIHLRTSGLPKEWGLEKSSDTK